MSSFINQLKCFLGIHDWEYTMRVLRYVSSKRSHDIRDIQTSIRYCKVCGRTETKGRSSKYWIKVDIEI